MAKIKLNQIVKIYKDGNDEKQTEVLKGKFIPENYPIAAKIEKKLNDLETDPGTSYDVQEVTEEICDSIEDFAKLNGLQSIITN